MGRGQIHEVGFIRGEWMIADKFSFHGEFYKNKPSGFGHFVKNGISSEGKFRQVNLRKENPNEAIYKKKVDSDQRQIILQWE